MTVTVFTLVVWITSVQSPIVIDNIASEQECEKLEAAWEQSWGIEATCMEVEKRWNV
jgi:hypothetical protein